MIDAATVQTQKLDSGSLFPDTRALPGTRNVIPPTMLWTPVQKTNLFLSDLQHATAETRIRAMGVLSKTESRVPRSEWDG
jgi:hypothetical protein